MERCPVFTDWQNIVKTATLLKAMCRCNVIILKIPMTFFTYMRNNPKLYMETQRLQIGSKALSRKDNDGAVTKVDLKVYPTAVLKPPGMAQKRHTAK